MTITRLMLKITALSFLIVSAACAIIAYWDKIVEITTRNDGTLDFMAASDFDDFED